MTKCTTERKFLRLSEHQLCFCRTQNWGSY